MPNTVHISFIEILYDRDVHITYITVRFEKNWRFSPVFFPSATPPGMGAPTQWTSSSRLGWDIIVAFQVGCFWKFGTKMLLLRLKYQII